MNRILFIAIAAACFALTGLHGSAIANLVVKNESKETIEVAVLYTEIFGQSVVWHRKRVSVKPDDSYTFKTNDMVLGRTANVFIYSPTQKENFFDKMPNESYKDGHYKCKVIEAPRYDVDFDRFGNQAIAGPASVGDFAPLIAAKDGETMEKAFFIGPLSREKKGVWLTYKALNEHLRFESR